MNYDRLPWIKGFKNLYRISPYGDVISYLQNPNGKALRPRKVGKYLIVTLLKNGVEHQVYVHRLVGIHYVVNPNPRKYKFVVHKTEDTTNNYALNLKWTDIPGKVKINKKNRKIKMEKEGMITRTLSEKQAKEIAFLLKNSTSRGKINMISQFFPISRNSLHRLRKTKKFKSLMNQSSTQS